jgi:hypothetical protein
MKLSVQPIWHEVVRRELPTVMGVLGLNGTTVDDMPKLALGRTRIKARWVRAAG